MSSRYDIYVLTEYLRTLKSKINSLCYNADKELTKAKSICRGKQLDKFFDKYRKDKLLKKHFNEIIKLTMDNIYLYNKTSDIETLSKIEICISHLIEQYKSAVIPGLDGISNADDHYSLEGKQLLIDFIDIRLLESIREKILV